MTHRFKLAAVVASCAALSAPVAAQEAYGAYGYEGGAAYAPPPHAYAPDPYAPPPMHGGYYGPAPVTALDEFTVYAPRSLGRSTIGAPIREVSISRAVSYADLDLTTQWGVDELMYRVRGAARSACRAMDIAHPISAGGDPPCYSDAVNRAMAQVDAALYDAAYRRR